jgi:methionine-gamma-lyase
VPSNSTDISYIINHLGEENENYFNAIAPPIIQTSNFSFPTVEAMRKAFQDEMGGYLYSRGLNPTVDILRKKLAALDGAEDALVFNSGAAAIFAGVLSNVKSGDHILSVHHPYSWALHMFDKILPRFGVTVTYADGTDTESFLSKVQSNTTFIYLESPNSWWLDIQDLKAIANFAKPRGIVTMIDNSYCTPLYQKPIEMGIDLAMQTATKYIGGHSDLIAGAVLGKKVLMKRVRTLRTFLGNMAGPWTGWLLMRSLETLKVRMTQQAENAGKVADFLAAHPKVEKVYYLGHLAENSKQYQIYKKQLSCAGAMVSFDIQGGEKEAFQFLDNLKLFHLAVSLGSTESLAEHPATMTHSDVSDEDRMQLGISEILIRLSIGVEHYEDLIWDIQQALDKVG